MRQVFSEIQQVAPTSASVLITGESGTGKELVARALHRLSPRSGGPFVPINCAALTETLIESELFGHEKGSFTGALERHIGCFEQANNGTVFLDEIGDMPIGTQAKLLRVLEDRQVRRLGGKHDLPVDVRVVAATNKIPEEAIKDKLLREDLYYRLNVFHIMLPPLRDRKDDIPAISEAILGNINKKHGCRITGLHPGTLERFQYYLWPGNVRELRNVLERAAIMAGEGMILPKQLAMESMAAPPEPQQSASETETEAPDSIKFRSGATMEEIEEQYINLVLNRTNNNKTKAADILGISVRTLHNRLGQLSNRKASGATG
jgi:DNA-binding NtrC family response regulator